LGMNPRTEVIEQRRECLAVSFETDCSQQIVKFATAYC
jgi:hypothetical protein